MANKINKTETPTSKNLSDDNSSPTDEHPEWHPFAVWQTQIKNRTSPTSTTGQHLALTTAKIADM